MANTDNRITPDCFNDGNIQAVRARLQSRLEEAEQGAEGKSAFRMINDGPRACNVTVTEGSRNITADILCCSYDYSVE